MKNGLVSIIIPVHNSEKYLKECLNSAIHQTYPDIEIIAVYDNYPDNSLKILNQFSNKITIITTKTCNIASARNKGIEKSKGEWIKFLDSDDVLYPNAVKELVSVGNNLRNKKNTILFSNYIRIDKNGKKIRKVSEKSFNDLDHFTFISKLLYINFWGLPSSSLVHRSTIESYGMFNEEFIVNEDWELWLRYCILHNCRLHLVPKFLVKNRKHTTSITAIRKNTLPYAERLKHFMKTKESILRQLDSSPLKEKYESIFRKYVEDRGAIINEIEKTTQHLLLNQKKIKELSGLDTASKKSVMKTSVNFLYNTLTLNQKINMKLINENKDLREKMKELRKRSLDFVHNTVSD